MNYNNSIDIMKCNRLNVSLEGVIGGLCLRTNRNLEYQEEYIQGNKMLLLLIQDLVSPLLFEI